MRKILLIFFLVILVAATSSASFQPVEVQIETNYTDIISSDDSSKLVPVRITNPSSATKDLNMSIRGTSNAKFVDGSEFKRLTMDKGTENFLVEVKPGSTGYKAVSLEVENLQYGTVTETKKTVYVKESSSNFEPKNVPGIGAIQIFSLLMMSTLAYFALL